MSRVLLAVTFVLAGVVCITTSVLTVAWVDNVARHERSAEIQAAVQAKDQGKAFSDIEPFTVTLSPLMTWVTFGIGGYLVGAGFILGVRSLSVGHPV